MITRIGVIGCGRIFKAHFEAISQNKNKCRLVAIADINQEAIDATGLKDKVQTFNKAEEMLVKMKGKMDMVVIATPNNTHYGLAIKSLRSGYDILIEKPITLKKSSAIKINNLAKKLNRKAYAVLQVRYNWAVVFLKKIIDKGILGKVRSVNLIQRWQRPDEYLEKWFGNTKISGGVLYEVGIHYLDIVQWIFGIPKVLSTRAFKLKSNNKHCDDTVYSILKFKEGFAGSLEVGIAAEPYNLECSLTVIGENGYIKIGGKALNEVEGMDFNIDEKLKKRLRNEVESEKKTLLLNYGKYNGSCPNHPRLYSEIFKGKGLSVKDAKNCIEFIEKINGASNN